MISINLIADRRNRKVREMMVARWSAIGVVFIFFSMIAINLLGVLDLRRTQQDAAVLAAQLEGKRVQYEELQQTIRQIEEIKPRVTLLEQVRVSEAAWMTIFADVARVVPDSVVLDSLQASGGDKEMQLRLAGKAVDQTAVGQFMEAIRTGTDWAKTPKTGPITTQKVGDTGECVAFSLTVPISGLVGGEF